MNYVVFISIYKRQSSKRGTPTAWRYLIYCIKRKLNELRIHSWYILPNLSEGVFLVICLGRHQKQPQNQWNSDGEVANKLWDICSHEALDFTVRNSKENDISHGVKTSPTRPTRHLKITSKPLCHVILEWKEICHMNNCYPPPQRFIRKLMISEVISPIYLSVLQRI